MSVREGYKQNKPMTPSVNSKSKVDQLRNNFFRNISNKIEVDGEQDKKKPYEEKKYNQRKSYDQDKRIVPRNYSAINVLQKDTQPKRQNKVRREFDVKLGNIDKINDKIQDLLEYVKNKKYIEPQQNKNQETIQAIRAKHFQQIKNRSGINEKTPRENGTKQMTNQTPNLRIKCNDKIKSQQQTQQEQRKLKIRDYLEKTKKQQITKEDRQIKNQVYDQTQKTEKQIQETNYFKSYQKMPNKQSYNYQHQEKQSYNYQQEKQDQYIVTNKSSYYQNRHRPEPKRRQILNDESLPSKYSRNQLNQYPQDVRTPTKNIKNQPNSKAQNISPIYKHKQLLVEPHRIPGNLDQEIQNIKSRIQESETQRKRLTEKYMEYSHIKTRNNQSNDNQQNQYESHEKKRERQQIYNGNWRRRQLEIKQKVHQKQQFKLRLYPCQIQAQKKEQTKLLADMLASQVKYDQKLKFARQEFSCLENAGKWNILKKQLEKQGIEGVNINQLEEELLISPEQHNPFRKDLSESNLDCIYQLAASYLQSLHFWNDNLKGCVNIEKLKRQNFSIKDLDLDRKGNLSIQDLVCFINLFSGTFYRNRDVMMMYRRFLKLQKIQTSISYETFERFLTFY